MFSSKSRSPFTQMYLTHPDAKGNDSPAILIDSATAANRAVNIPECVNIPPDGLLKIDTPAMDFFRVFDLAVDLMRSNQLGAAVTAWKRAAGLNPDDARVLFKLALSLERKGQISEAIPQYQKALEIDPENRGACTNLGIALARTGKLAEAIDRFAKFLATSPGSAKAHSNLGAALMQAGRIDEATQHLRNALDLDPEFPDANYSFSLLPAETGRRDEGFFISRRPLLRIPMISSAVTTSGAS